MRDRSGEAMQGVEGTGEAGVWLPAVQLKA